MLLVRTKTKVVGQRLAQERRRPVLFALCIRTHRIRLLQQICLNARATHDTHAEGTLCRRTVFLICNIEADATVHCIEGRN